MRTLVSITLWPLVCRLRRWVAARGWVLPRRGVPSVVCRGPGRPHGARALRSNVADQQVRTDGNYRHSGNQLQPELLLCITVSRYYWRWPYSMPCRVYVTVGCPSAVRLSVCPVDSRRLSIDIIMPSVSGFIEACFQKIILTALKFAQWARSE